MNENIFIKILRLIVLVGMFIFLGYGVYSLGVEAIQEKTYWILGICALMVGAQVVIIINLINIIKNWKFYWNS